MATSAAGASAQTQPVPAYWSYSPGATQQRAAGGTPPRGPDPDDPWRLGDVFPTENVAAAAPRKRRRPGWFGVGAAAIAAGVVGGLVGASLAPQQEVSLPTSSETVTIDPVTPARAPESVAGIAESALPSVVSISTPGGSGSGFIITDDGYIITNNHVIAGSNGVQVSLQDGRTVDAEIVGTSPAYDLAVLDVSLVGLTPLALGDSDQVVVGDPVVAVGSPLGLEGTVTSGIVSATNRPVTAGGSGEVSFINAVQTDAAINPGNSGGPLLDAAGRVIGVNSSIAALQPGVGGQVGSIGLGFSIPINQARTTAEEIIADGEASYPIIGATLAVGPGSQGAVIDSVVPGGPAEQEGLRPGDRIVSIDGTTVPSSDELIVAIRSRQPGDTVELTVLRGDEQSTVTVTLDERVG